LQNAQIRSEGIVPGPFQASRFSRRLAALATVTIASAFVIAAFGASNPVAAQQGYGNIFGYDTGKPQPRKRAVRRHSPPRDDTAATAKVAKDVKEAKESKAGKKDGTKEAKKDAKPAAPTDPVYVVISIADQHVSVYDANGAIAHSRVSTGMPGHPTPVGVFSVIGKERWHHSNIYSGAPMPWMQRITWSGVAMHLGVVPGYPASHGCIRLPAAFAPQLWGMTKMGARVVVARRDAIPFEISNAFLPLPKMQPAPGTQQASNAPASAPIELASMSPQAGVATAAVTDAPASAPAPKLLNPMEYAAALKQHATADKAASEKAAKEALAAAQTAGTDARQSVDDVRKAEADVKTAELKIAELDAAAAAAKQAADAAAAQAAQATTTPTGQPTQPQTPQPQSTQQATSEPVAATAPAAQPASPTTTQALGSSEAQAAAAAARTTAEAELARAQTALDDAKRHETETSSAAFAAVQVYKAAVAASEAAAETLIEAGRRVEPVSVMISKKEGRVFIRQDWKEVYEAAVAIRDPDRPLGTHLFIAVAAQPDGSSMRWSAITAPENSPGDNADRKRSKKGAEDAPPPPAGPASTAAEALDRIEMAPAARERIAELLWTGGSLIVSDHARSDEMDSDTDFIVSTR
jgi:lipoprotein-anchoring transpeptidase ErfK/SrfK